MDGLLLGLAAGFIVSMIVVALFSQRSAPVVVAVDTAAPLGCGSVLLILMALVAIGLIVVGLLQPVAA